MGTGARWTLVAAVVSVVFAPSAVAVDNGPGDPNANLRLPAKGGKLLGVNGTFDSSSASAPEILGQLAKAGMSAARRTLAWASAEPVRDQWDERAWGDAAEFYSAALSHGMTPIFGLGFAPGWARAFPWQLCNSGNGFCAFPPTPAYDSEWEEFAAEAARRFPRATFEIWNEPNTPTFWKPSPDPVRFAELVAMSYRAIKQVNPAARVIICGCAGTLTGARRDHGMPIDEFLAAAYESRPSIRGNHDGISLHFFPQAYGPKPLRFGKGSPLARLLDRVERVTRRYDEPKARLWIDEVGYHTRDTQPHAGGPPVSERQAARGLAILARRLLTSPRVKAVLIHREMDGPPGIDRYSVRDSSFGLLRRAPLLGRKPAYCRLAAMAGRYRQQGCPKLIPPDTAARVVRSEVPGVTELRLRSQPAGLRFECRINRARWARCADRQLLVEPKPGRNEVMARAYRGDGTQDETPARLRFIARP